MLVLFETAGGYAIFKLLNEKKLSQSENLYTDFVSPEKANKIIKLLHFQKFLDTSEAVSSVTAPAEGKLGKSLKKVLKKTLKDNVGQQLLVADPKLGNIVKEKFDVPVLATSPVQELMRCIRSQAETLLCGQDFQAMSLGLAHSLSRYKLKCSPDKVDIMIVHAIGLLDELDKELNNYVMRCREWYGWHFPELGKIITDNLKYVEVIKHVGLRDNFAKSDISDFVPEEIEEEVKRVAEESIGTDISVLDIINIQLLCTEVIELTAYRTQLYEYLKARMFAMAPNLTVLLGELIGARLIAHSGSLTNLAKLPSSTIQIAGAEKALFRALKTQQDTPKYGLLYHSNIVAGASTKNKGKISRSLAAKASLAARTDALGEEGTTSTLGEDVRLKLESRLRFLEEGNLRTLSGTAKTKAKFEKYHGKSEFLRYSKSDSTLGQKRKKPLIEDITTDTPDEPKRKIKKIKVEEDEEAVKVKVEVKEEYPIEENIETPTSSKKKKKKNKIKQESED